MIIARTKQGAEVALIKALKKHGLKTKADEIAAMDLVPMEEDTVIILDDGNY